jgi:hypothetical protein
MPGPANKTVTYTGSTAVVHSLHFSRDPSAPNGAITAEIVGRVTLVGGAFEFINAPAFVLSGAIETAVRNLMDGQALTRLRTVNGIEAP